MLSHGRGAHAATAIGSARPTQVASPPARRRAAPRPRTRSAAQAAPPSQDGASTSGRGEDHQQAAAILVEHAGLTAEDAALAARALAGACPDLLRASAAALAARFKPSHVRHIAVHAPGALRLDVKSWVTFLEVGGSGAAAADGSACGRAVLCAALPAAALMAPCAGPRVRAAVHRSRGEPCKLRHHPGEPSSSIHSAAHCARPQPRAPQKWAGDDVVWSVLRHQHEALAETDVFKAGASQGARRRLSGHPRARSACLTRVRRHTRTPSLRSLLPPSHARARARTASTHTNTPP